MIYIYDRYIDIYDIYIYIYIYIYLYGIGYLKNICTWEKTEK